MLMALLTAMCCSSAMAAGTPLKVYILAGQSNMEGHAKVETRVWISYLTGSPDKGALGEGTGKLTAGYGSRSNPTEDGGKIGPEFTFGIALENAYDGPILLIKTAWGGKSLNTDFRPPSAGPYEFNEAQLEGFKKQGKDIAQAKADKAKATGRYYKLMIEHVKKVLADPKRVVPDYDPKQGYEIAGFAWLQGWNDMVDSGTYPDRAKPDGYAKYGHWMADFIRDVRKDLGVPKMPFVIGVMGVGGSIDDKYNPRYKVTHQNFRDAMAAPTKLPEFKGNVAAVRTELYWDKPLEAIEDKLGQVGNMGRQLKAKAKGTPNEDGKMTPKEQQEYLEEYRAKLITPEEETMWKRGASNAGYHYLGCAKTFALMGKAFAEALLEMERKRS